MFNVIAILLMLTTPFFSYAFITKDVNYESGNHKISGTLALPEEQNGKRAAIILISGSGKVTRESEREPYNRLSEAFTKAGLAVLYFDKRGTGESTGNYATATTKDFANDVEAGIKFLKSRDDINEKQIGLFGHSEGGLIASMIAAESKDVAFLILYAPPGIKMKDLLEKRNELRTESLLKMYSKEKETIDLIKASNKTQKYLLSQIIPTDTIKTNGEAKEKIEVYLQKENYPENISKQIMIAINEQLEDQPILWLRSIFNSSASDYLEKVTIPVFAVFGENDFYVPASHNVKPVENALSQAGNKNYIINSVNGLGHDYEMNGQHKIDVDLLNKFAQAAEKFIK